MASTIVRQDKGGKNEQWQIDVGPDLVILTKPDGIVYLKLTPVQIAQYVVFPSFSRSIKYPIFKTSEGHREFRLDGPSLKALRTFANRGIASAGPKAARSVLMKAIGWTVFGFVLMGLGIFALTLTVHEVATGKSETNNSPHPVGLVSSLVGLGVLGRGIYGFRQYAQIKKLSSQ
jgi:hypothetical protein